MRLLLITACKKGVSHLAGNLASIGHKIQCEINFDQAVDFLKKNPPELCLLAGFPPDYKYHYFVGKLRSRKINVPVIILSIKSSQNEIISSLRAGADDFITDNVCFDEISARIDAVFRRFNSQLCPVIGFPPCELDTSSKILYIHEKPVFLTRFEYITLEVLMRNKNKLITRERILSCLYDDASLHNSDVVNVIICRLRKKIKKTSHFEIVCVRGCGYYFTKKKRFKFV